MLAKIFGLLTPEFKLKMAVQHLGVSQSDLSALEGALARASTHPAVAMFTGGKPLSLLNLFSVVSEPQTSEMVSSALPAVRKMVSTDEGAHALASAIMTYVNQDPAGEVITSVLEEASHLPFVGFADVEHDGPADFLARAVLPKFRASEPDPDEAVVAPFRCRYCGHTDHLTIIGDHFLHSCTECNEQQVVNLVQG